MEEEAEKKIGWLFKLIFAGTATIVGYNIFPYLGIDYVAKLYTKLIKTLPHLWIVIDKILTMNTAGDNLIQQSVSLLDVKDPLFKRMGASRLTRFATDGIVDSSFMCS